MSLYTDYFQLAESNQLDKVIYNSFIYARLSLVFLFLIDGPIFSVVPLMALFVRTFIPDVYVRRTIGWILILWCYYNQMYSWSALLFSIESMRELFRFGIPYLMTKTSINLPDDPAVETLIRRLFKILRLIGHQSASLSMQQLIITIMCFTQGDGSERFDPHEKEKFRKFFRDFSQTSFIYEPDTSSITIFFPSFIIRFSHKGLQLTSDDLKLIRGGSKGEEICPICHDQYSDLSIKLKCSHRYCHKCIFNWLNQEYICPMCRTTIV